ncbi:hypothetical protein PMAYCL1PPCAC_18733 [Pristionchus mayeri]|uniref:Uncharacterized protein n=1 Tax=Pristionchus mayeri TaxID=1317129 RepID=A0AAN5I1P2_9BILA|nr:hypothetical protein PMAYCL1PPCAC_18733 [Pristionchus mayeri]
MFLMLLESPWTLLLFSTLSLLSLHFLLFSSFFEFTNFIFLVLSAVYCIFHYFTSPSHDTPVFLTNRRVLVASSLLAFSLLLSYEAYDIGRFHRWHSILLSLPLLFDGRSRLFVASVAISSFFSFHLISTEVKSIDQPFFVPWLSSDLRSIIACSFLIYATVLLSKEQLEPRMLAYSVFSVLLLSTATRELLWPEMRDVTIYYNTKYTFPIVPFLLIIVSHPISILSYGHRLIFDRSLSHVFNVFCISRNILLLVSRIYLFESDEASFIDSLPSVLFALVSLCCSCGLWISLNIREDEQIVQSR